MTSIKKRYCIALLTMLTMAAFFGCKNSDYTDKPILTTAISQIDTNENNHEEQIHDYDSPYTICYRNKNNTYSMYVFSSPIQYNSGTGYEIIDNTVVKTEKEGFAYENRSNEIKTYFPLSLSEYFVVEQGTTYIKFKPNWNVEGFTEAQESIFTNMYGDKVYAVIYKRDDMEAAFYPTKAGIKAEIVLRELPQVNTFDFIVKSSNKSYENNQNGYIVFKSVNENKSVIYGPLVQYTHKEKQQMDATAKIGIDRERGNTNVLLTIDEDILDNISEAHPVRFDLAFDLYLNKLPDSTVYSKHDINNYLANYAVIGNHPVFGVGWHYLRFRLNHFMTQPPKNLLSAKYSVKKLYSNSDKIELLLSQPTDQWSSTGLKWESKVEINDMEYNYDYAFSVDNWCEMDITAFIKECFSDQSLLCESRGIVLSMQKEAPCYMVFATSDNALYTPYIELEFSDLPLEFTAKENIND